MNGSPPALGKIGEAGVKGGRDVRGPSRTLGLKRLILAQREKSTEKSGTSYA